MVGVPEIDIEPLIDAAAASTTRTGTRSPDGFDAWARGAVIETAAAIDTACREVGFFTVAGHGVDPELIGALHDAARRFFALPEERKAEIAMAHGGRAWRGWFPLGGELTGGVPDRKEGLYVGTELGPDDPRVAAATPLHGANLFPTDPAELGPLVLGYLDELTRVGQAVLAGMAVGLGLDHHWFLRHLTADPVVLFRMFHYPATPTDTGRTDGDESDDRWADDDEGADQRDRGDREGDDDRHGGASGNRNRHGGASGNRSCDEAGGGGHDDEQGSPDDGERANGGWGVGEHTDYGLLTLLGQDGTPGLEVRGAEGWVAVDARTDRFVANIGDMLERLTGGRYRSTPHRVRNTSGVDRLSFPFFLDPSWDVVVDRLPIVERPLDDDGADRWDRTSVHGFTGTYGEYLLAKVTQVFPTLAPTEQA